FEDTGDEHPPCERPERVLRDEEHDDAGRDSRHGIADRSDPAAAAIQRGDALEQGRQTVREHESREQQHQQRGRDVREVKCKEQQRSLDEAEEQYQRAAKCEHALRGKGRLGHGGRGGRHGRNATTTLGDTAIGRRSYWDLGPIARRAGWAFLIAPWRSWTRSRPRARGGATLLRRTFPSRSW